MRLRSDTINGKTYGDRLYYGYVVVAACFAIFLMVYGVHYAFGVFLKPMIAELKWSRAAISGAYSLSWLIQGPSGLLMGRLNDRFGPRLVLSICGSLIFLGLFLTSHIDTSWQFYLSYGILIGCGTGGIYVPLVSTIARWFSNKRNTMTGIAISGMGFGTFLFSPAANHLISTYGWRFSYTTLAISILIVTLCAAQLLRLTPASRQQTDATQSASDFSEKQAHTSHSLNEAIRSLEFWKIFSMFFCFGFCLMAILVHIAPHATDIIQSTTIGAGLVATIGISSIIGKVVFGRFGDLIGNQKIYMLCFFIMLASLLLLISVRQEPLLYVFTVMFGLAYGGNASSQSPLTAVMFGLTSHGAILGALNIGFTLGATMGPVVAGFLFDYRGNYGAAFIVLACFAIAGFALAVTLRRHLRAR